MHIFLYVHVRVHVFGEREQKTVVKQWIESEFSWSAQRSAQLLGIFQQVFGSQLIYHYF